MVEATALWLVPGLDHPVYARFADFFRTLFRRFEALDYRALYLERGQSALEAQIIEALQRSGFPGKLINLKGGITAWSDEVDPRVPKY